MFKKCHFYLFITFGGMVRSRVLTCLDCSRTGWRDGGNRARENGRERESSAHGYYLVPRYLSTLTHAVAIINADDFSLTFHEMFQKYQKDSFLSSGFEVS